MAIFCCKLIHVKSLVSIFGSRTVNGSLSLNKFMLTREHDPHSNNQDIQKTLKKTNIFRDC